MFTHDTPGCECAGCQRDRKIHETAESILEMLKGKGITQGCVLGACIRVVAFITMRGEVHGTRGEGIQAVLGLLTDEINAYVADDQLKAISNETVRD